MDTARERGSKGERGNTGARRAAAHVSTIAHAHIVCVAAGVNVAGCVVKLDIGLVVLTMPARHLAVLVMGHAQRGL